MNEHLTNGAVSLLVLILYVVIKDITVPLLRRWQNSRHPGGNPDNGDLRAVAAKYDAQWEEQRRVNDRVDRNITRIFERLDKERK